MPWCQGQLSRVSWSSGGGGAVGGGGRRDEPEEHLTGLAVGRLVKRVHLEAMMVGIGLVRLDVRPGETPG